MSEIEVISYPGNRAIALRHEGSPTGLQESWPKFIGLATEYGLFQPGKRALTIIEGGATAIGPTPETVFFLGVEADAPQAPAGLEVQDIPQGEYAKYVHVGWYDGLPAAWSTFMTAAESVTGRAIGEGPMFEIYVDDPNSTPQDQLRTELYIPVR